jgi:copper chaperone CopZ
VVKEALLELPGVELVRDEWDNDLLHVTYDTQQVTVEKMLETIAAEGFEAAVK